MLNLYSICSIMCIQYQARVSSILHTWGGTNGYNGHTHLCSEDSSLNLDVVSAFSSQICFFAPSISLWTLAMQKIVFDVIKLTHTSSAEKCPVVSSHILLSQCDGVWYSPDKYKSRGTPCRNHRTSKWVCSPLQYLSGESLYPRGSLSTLRD